MKNPPERTTDTSNKSRLKVKTDGRDSPLVFAIHKNYLMVNIKKYGIIRWEHIIRVLFGGIYDKSPVIWFYGTIVHEDSVVIDEITTIISNTGNGADSFWYWEVDAFVFAGDETVVSVSGKDYKVTDRTIQENDINTIDLSPQKNNIWGIMKERLYLK